MYDNGTKNIIKILAISTLLIISCIGIYTYRQYDNYKSNEAKYENIENVMKAELNTYIISILDENKKKVELCTKLHSEQVTSEVLKEYKNDVQQLQQDISNPNPDTKLTKIFDKTLGEIYYNKNSLKNKPIVISMNKILWNRSIGLKKQTIDLNTFINSHYNPKLCKDAIYSIQNMNTRGEIFSFWQDSIKGFKTDLGAMNINNIIDIYNTYGLDALKSFELLVPVYITNDGDIFGTKDLNSLGEPIKNYKMIIIQRINMYDVLKCQDKNLLYFNDQISNMEQTIINNKKNAIANIEESLLIIVFVLLISGYLQNTLYIDNK